MLHTFRDDDGDVVTVASSTPIAFIRLTRLTYDRKAGYRVEVNFAGPFGGTELTLDYDTRERAEETYRALEALLTN